MGGHFQLCDYRMDLGEGQTDQASKYLGLRIIKTLDEISISKGKLSFP